MLDLNFSVVVVSIFIFILWKILEPLFFRPVGRMIDERDDKIAADKQRLQELTDLIRNQTASIEQQVGQTQKDAQKIKEELIQKGEALRRQLVETSRSEAARLSLEKAGELERQITAAEVQLQHEVETFSTKLRESILA